MCRCGCHITQQRNEKKPCKKKKTCRILFTFISIPKMTHQGFDLLSSPRC